MTKLTQPGNTKLGRHTYMFNLPASQAVCGRTCKGCYAIREAKRFPAVAAAREARFAASQQPDFAQRVISELKALRKPPKFFRFHASGEVYSQPYLDSLVTIASSLPNITFYLYTKRLSDFDFSAAQALPNFIVINSLHFGSLNYGKLHEAPTNAFICPTGTDKSAKCGDTCTYCMTKQAEQNGVFFVKH